MANSSEHTLHRDLSEYADRRRDDGPYADNLDIDILIVGGGFGGIYLLYELRKAGFNPVIYEAGTSFGGTWRFNAYPGARVDSEVPIYQLSIPEVYKTWTWTTNYPDYHELQAYFDHVGKVLNLSEDTAFNTVVTSAEFSIETGKWTVHTADGRTAKTKYLIIAAGFASKRYIPDYPGLDKYKGVVHHSSFWPTEGVNPNGQKVAVIGTGASGVQITQEWGPAVKKLVVFQRTPNLALPMGKRDISKEEQQAIYPVYDELMRLRETTFAGFIYDFTERTTFEDSPQEREALYEQLWEKAGFNIWLGNYKDYLFDMAANRLVYDFWRKKQSARIKDPRKRELLCPTEPPHPFGVKRPCLEQNFYEVLDRDNVEIVDISDKSNNKISEFTETGIKTSDGKHYDVDIIALATGFDVGTGGITNMGLKSVHGTTLKEEWKTGAYTYLGMTISGYPNLFSIYGPHGPTLLANGPTAVEVQGRWIRDAIKLAERECFKYFDPTPEASKQWKAHIVELSDATLLPTTRSTYMGGSVPGKPFEPISYSGGVPAYVKEIRAVLPKWTGFETVKG
ncbi:cyclohexanone monooxygenase [Fusarium mundagurra]|uniref:Cyclohexanone monooxygenase n=1 Tax=Fusarium mundagurra TaxID=1567541 RepID=A0A8H5XYK4_9HYPO|nr:cyclohexanone monooxygenase [Fusarium mundagurra]